MNVDLLIASLPALAAGLWLSLQLLATSMVIGSALALPVAMARVAGGPWLRWSAAGFIGFFRGTPLLVQMFLIYYGAGQFHDALVAAGVWPAVSEAYRCAVIAFALNTAAYTAEILRGGIEAVPRGEIEAARALGLRPAVIYGRVILPQACRLALPAYGNEIVIMLKSSALVSVIALVDLMGAARTLYSRTFTLEVYLYAAVLYGAVTAIIAWSVGWAERRWPIAPATRPAARIQRK
jgi:His/Glu/Gln/Arg/opine family amino acid ABC transporter permease subunit